jgi:hypothetical protein
MKNLRRRITLAVALVAATSTVAVGQSTIPSRLSDKDFWQFIVDVSEPGGYFRSDNFLSNEMGFQHPIPELKKTTSPGGVYLGVGPEQNFSYIAALQPKLAVIFDIRRQNMVQHLMYKSLFETSADRGEFLAKLFSRMRPAGLDSATTPVALFQAFVDAQPDSLAYRRNLLAIRDWWTKQHGFPFSAEDSASLDYVYSAFYQAGPLINYSFRPNTTRPVPDSLVRVVTPGSSPNSSPRVVIYSGGFGRGMASYSELQTATDASGNYLAYLASEANYRWIKDLETRNMLIPVVGDFAGPKAIRSVGQYLRDHQATVTAFYLSNVEHYLFQQGDDWRRWFENAGTLPLNATSTFIRSGRGGTSMGVTGLASLLASMQDQLKAFAEGRINFYYDVINSSH